ncbi:IS701 family transposase [Streptomyces sp. NPDC050485]|uniref:IS701 family transposase n=1 Tax=Streptomyces sp. NPDC050485 TaxID=3365617 RepID=UPI0037A7CC82
MNTILPVCRREDGAGVDGGILDTVVTEVFSVLRRRDQRRTAEQYLRALLAAKGRKSVRNLATTCSDGAAEQRLHHFVSASPWDFGEARAALARLLDRLAPAQAWVVRPLVIPKAGNRSPGVRRRYVPEVGGSVNSQLAYGLWHASADGDAPVGWRLQLPGDRLFDPHPRRRAGLAEDRVEEAPAVCAVSAALGPIRAWGLAARPVVMDLSEVPPAVLPWVFRSFTEAAAPLLVRVRDTTRVIPVRPALPSWSGRAIPLRELLRATPQPRRPVALPQGGASAALLRVRLPGGPLSGIGDARPSGPPAPASRADDLLVLAVWDGAGPVRGRVWLTGPTRLPPRQLLRLAQLQDRVAAAAAGPGEQVGLRDFEGRTYLGWHRHMTLASAAHAVLALSAAPHGCRPSGQGGPLA